LYICDAGPQHQCITVDLHPNGEWDAPEGRDRDSTIVDPQPDQRCNLCIPHNGLCAPALHRERHQLCTGAKISTGDALLPEHCCIKHHRERRSAALRQYGVIHTHRAVSIEPNGNPS
jgi:hypothetical protein